MAKPARNSVRAIDASGVSDCPANTIDGSRAITAVAEQFGSQARLAAAVSNSAECDGQGSNAPQDITNAHRGLVKLAPAELDEGYAQSRAPMALQPRVSFSASDPTCIHGGLARPSLECW